METKFKTQIASHIRSVYQANADARSEVTEQLRRAKLAADTQYDPALLSKITSGIGGSKTYYPITRIKSKSAAAWIKKIITTAQKPWSIVPTPDPDLDENSVQQIADAAMQEQQRIAELNLDMTVEDCYDFAQDMRNILMQQRNTRAAEAAARAETIISDKLTEASFNDAFDDFISDFCLYPAAFLRSVRTLDKVSRVEKQIDQTGEETFAQTIKISEMMHFERISPIRVFPSAGQINVDDDDLVIVSLLSLKEIADMASLPGYNAAEINALIAEHQNSTLNSNARDPLDAFPEAKLFSADNSKYRRSSRIAALEYYGRVSGNVLKEWCCSGVAAAAEDEEALPEIMDVETGRWMKSNDRNDTQPAQIYSCGCELNSIVDAKFYDVYAITVHDRCIYCRITTDEPRHIYSASFERNSDSIWGAGIGEMLKHVQADINAIRRATSNNLNLSSYPQIIVNDDILAQFAPGSQPTFYPGKIWHTRNSFAGVQKPVDFFNIPNVYNALSAEFERLLVVADRVSGIPEYSQGLSSGARNGAAGTASGLSMLLEAAGNQIKDPINNLDKGVIEPLIRDLYYELLNDPEVPNDAKGDFKIVALGANGIIFKEQISIRRREFLQLVMASPLLQQLVKPEGVTALIRQVADDLGMESDDIVATKTELLEQKKIAEQQQQMAEMQQAAAAAGEEAALEQQEDIQ